MNPFEQWRDFISTGLATGLTYRELAAELNGTEISPPKGGEWTEDSTYNACRRLNLSSVRPCPAQPRASRTRRAESTRRAATAAQQAIDAGTVSVDDLQRGRISEVAARLGVSDWTWRQYRVGALNALGITPTLQL